MLPTRLEATDLSKSFGGPPLFSRLSLAAERGLVAVTGINGSGKTTLLKILATLLRPEAGTVRVLREGRELLAGERRRAVGWAGPDLAFYDELTAEENLGFFRRAGGLAAEGSDLERRLERVGLAGTGGRPVGHFSSGMTQRLRIAFALLFDPPLLLLDEPNAGLDADGRERVAAIVSERRSAGVVILASNDPSDFASPEQVIHLGDGVRR